MNKSRSYFTLLEALREPECPVCRLVVEDGRAYLDHLLYESVLDVPTRMTLIESFGFCSWHTGQMSSLPPICAPSEGFAIFASDLLRKLDYVGRDIIQRRPTWKWKFWFKKNHGRLLALIKQRPCPACDHVKQFETYHLNDLLDAIGDKEFFDAYEIARGICLPHLLISEELYSSHPNFSLLFEAQLTKIRALRGSLKEYIRKQDFRFRDQITPEEAKSPRLAMEVLIGKPSIFANEMGHDLSQRLPPRPTSDNGLAPALSRLKAYQPIALFNELKISKQVTLCLKKPLPADLLERLAHLTEERDSRPETAAIVEDLDIDYLRRLHSAGLSLFYGIGLPEQSLVLLDCKRGFLIDENEAASWRLRLLKNAEDLYLSLLWHKFGIAVSLAGVIQENDFERGLFSVKVDGKSEQWCRFKDPRNTKLPEIGANVELFGWQKWNTQVVEVLELTCRKDGTK
jgi:Family of unknown function (DUF6062)